MSYNAIGKVWTAESFEQYLKNTTRPTWCNAICLHHTAAPSLQMRPKGLLMQHIHNMKDGYVEKGWKSGPHLYIDEDQIYAMTPLTERGVHAVSFNARAIGIEVLGDYDNEDPFTSRGLQCWQLAARTTNELLRWLNLPMNENTILFHRDDPKTSKTCPGTRIEKKWFFDLMHRENTSNAFQEPVKIKSLCAPVIDFVVEHKKYSYAEAANLLKNINNLFVFDGDWLEGAYYDKDKGVTMAPVAELQAVKSR